MSAWPLPYLLEIYDAVLKHGYLYIEPISEQDAISLRQSLYRLRRRSDTLSRELITREHHLVTVGKWDCVVPGGTVGRLPIIYNKAPSGSLPRITPVEEGDVFERPLPIPAQMASPSPPTPFIMSEDEARLDPEDVESFVAKMIRNATGGSDADA